MKKIGFWMAALFVALLLAGCSIPFVTVGQGVAGSGRVITEKRSVSNFSSIELAGLGELTLVQGDSEALTVEGEDNLLPLITTEVRGSTLVIGIKDRTAIVPTKPLRYNVQLKNLDAVTVSGAGLVRSDQLKTGAFRLVTSGAGSVELKNVQATQLTTTLSGTGNVQLSGEAPTQTATLSGLGNYDSGNLKSNTATVQISGAGSATVWAQTTLNVTITGAGGVRYYGSPTVTKNITGLGGVQSLGSK